MLIEHNENGFEVVTEHHICEYHKQHPEDKGWPGCTCSSSILQKKKEKEDKTAS